jgi:hypothetical protein
MNRKVKRSIIASERGTSRSDSIDDLAQCELMHKIIKRLIKDSEVAKEQGQSKKSQALLFEAWKITLNIMEACVV